MANLTLDLINCAQQWNLLGRDLYSHNGDALDRDPLYDVSQTIRMQGRDDFTHLIILLDWLNSLPSKQNIRQRLQYYLNQLSPPLIHARHSLHFHTCLFLINAVLGIRESDHTIYLQKFLNLRYIVDDFLDFTIHVLKISIFLLKEIYKENGNNQQ